MRSLHLRATSLIIALTFIAGLPMADGAAKHQPRIAILGEGEAGGFADVLMGAISSQGTCSLVDRAQLDRLADEAALKGIVAHDRSQALAKLANADALLFASTDRSDAKHPLLVLRLTAGADGRVKHGVILPWLPSELEATARLAASQFKKALQRLVLDGAAPPLTISLLGIRGAVDSSETRSLETTLNSLLAHHLAQQPGVSLLERWRMDDLVFERSLAPLGPQPFAKAALFVDGVLEIKQGTFQVRLRLRHSDTEKGIVHTIEGTMQDLAKSAGEMVKVIGGDTPGMASIKSAEDGSEAKTFAELGLYLIRNELAPQAVQALESAVALGDNSYPTLMARIEAYAFCAMPYRLGGFRGVPAYRSFKEFEREDAAFRIAAATHAVDLAADILKMNASSFNDAERKRADVFATGAFVAASGVLRVVHEARLHLEKKVPVARLRAGSKGLVSLIDASALGGNYLYLLARTGYAACWCSSPEETLECYRIVFSPEYLRKIDPFEAITLSRSLRTGFFTFTSQHGPFLDRPVFPPDRPGMAWLMDWENADNVRIQKLWSDFILELRASPDLSMQSLGRGFEIAAHCQPENRARLVAESVEFLSKNQERLAQEESELAFIPLHLGIRALCSDPKSGGVRDVLIQFFQNYLSKSHWESPTCLSWVEALGSAGTNSNLSKQTVTSLITALDGLATRSKGVSKWKEDPGGMVQARASLLRACPEAASEDTRGKPDEEALTVSRLWSPVRHATPPARRGALEGDSFSEHDDRLWFFHSGLGIVSVDPSSLNSRVTGFEPRNRGTVYEILPWGEGIWAAASTNLWRNDLKSGPWSKFDVPERTYTMRMAGDRLLIGSMPPHQTLPKTPLSGFVLAEISRSHELQWLVSSRRQPTEHPLDNLDVKHVLGVFPGPGGPWAALWMEAGETQVFSLTEPQQPKFVFPREEPTVKACGKRTLLYETPSFIPKGTLVVQAWLVDPDLAAPVSLLNHPALTGPAESVPPRWPMRDVVESPMRPHLGIHSPTMHQDGLWILRTNSSNQSRPSEIELTGLLPGRSKPVHIPLRLAPSAEDIAAFRTLTSNPTSEYLTRGFMGSKALVATSYGLAFTGEPCPVVWIIPWTDIHAWIKNHPGS